MNKSVQRRWESVYRQTEYKVMLDSGAVTLKIGEYDAEVESRLIAQTDMKREWFIITPCNPRSQQARAELNLYYLNELRYEVEARAGRWVQALNCDPRAEWPDEPGFLLVDAGRLWVIALGERFYQNAVVTAQLGEAPRLLWLGS
jgi:hypothetical protein